MFVTTISGDLPSRLRTAVASPPMYMNMSSLSSAPYSVVELLWTIFSVPDSAMRNTSSIDSPQNPLP